MSGYQGGSGYGSGYGQSRSGYDGGRPRRDDNGYSTDHSGRARSRSLYRDSRQGDREDSRHGSHKRSYDNTFYTSDGVIREGLVKWFNASKGYGFITREDGTPDLFVHHSGIVATGFRSLSEGDKVTYSLETGSDGRNRACNVVGQSQSKRSRGDF